MRRGQGYSLPNAARRASPAVLGCSSGICISNSGRLDPCGHSWGGRISRETLVLWERRQVSLPGVRCVVAPRRAGGSAPTLRSALVLRERCRASLLGVRRVVAPLPASRVALSLRSARVSSSYASLSLFPWRFGHCQEAICFQSRRGTVLCGSCWHQGRSNGCRLPPALHRRGKRVRLGASWNALKRRVRRCAAHRVAASKCCIGRQPACRSARRFLCPGAYPCMLRSYRMADASHRRLRSAVVPAHTIGRSSCPQPPPSICSRTITSSP